MPLAVLVTADRYMHIAAEIDPALAAGDDVVCDRYVASTLVLREGHDRADLASLASALLRRGLLTE